ncbi:VWA domain-containing protein [Segetibacter koreensis]|uniref:VWA domain-containing protein n=1 Tax=Segetibacter koreensis TaxID=398037 RepID=UPI000377A22B|nr:VWA domain-containing protein [Segetibacter koreensis]
MLSFQHIEFLPGLLVLVPLCTLFIFLLRWKKKVKNQIGDEELVNALTSDYSAKNYNYKFLLIIAAIALCIVGAANIRKPAKGNTGNRAGIDVMIALDVSNSMLAQDIKPNRLERAKQVISRIIDKMGNNRMGMVVFAGQAFLQMPMTSDLAAARLYVSNAGPDAVPTQGTVIGDALRLCNTALDTKEKKYKAVILISDGEDHDEKADAALKELEDNGVVVYTIGIGSPQGAPIFDPALNDYKKDENGNTVVSKLNEKDLQKIATQTGGQYLLFTSADDVATQLAASIDQMEKKQIGGTGIRVYSSYFQWFLLIAFILLLLETIIPERKMKWFSWEK